MGLFVFLLSFIRDNSFDKLLNSMSIVICIFTLDELKRSINKSMVHINSFECLHVVCVEIIFELIGRQQSIIVLIEFFKS